MKRVLDPLCLLTVTLTALLSLTTPSMAQEATQATPAAANYTAAILPFEEKGVAVKDMGAKVADILFAKLAARPDLMLVERSQMEKILQESEINISGLVNPQEATKLGQLVGARIIITGSVFEVSKKLYIVAKIIGTETGRVLASSADGSMDQLAVLTEQMANDVGNKITAGGQTLVAIPRPAAERIAGIKNQLGQQPRPKVFVQVPEVHIGQPTYDPAAQTELIYILRETGFEVIDPDKGSRGDADVLLTGEAFSEFALRKGNLVSVKARLELKATNTKTNTVIATDRTTAVKVDLSEHIAGKAALQEAAAILAERIIPKLIQ